MQVQAAIFIDIKDCRRQFSFSCANQMAVLSDYENTVFVVQSQNIYRPPMIHVLPLKRGFSGDDPIVLNVLHTSREIEARGENLGFDGFIHNLIGYFTGPCFSAAWSVRLA